MNRWQCCYTNTESGWKSVAISTGIPPKALEQCEKFQISNSRIEGVMLDEEGQALNLYSIFTDESFAYAIRSQYGLQDRFGRPNMFSCAYMISIEEFIKNPNVLLGISKSDFEKNIEEAQTRLEKGIERYQEINIKEALEILKMEKAVYQNLLYTIYTRSKDASRIETTYITKVQNELEMQALLYLICTGLPNFIRKRLKISNAIPTQSEKYNLILMRKKEIGFDFHTGKGSYTTPNLSGIYEILDTYVELALQGEADTYFEQLESMAIQLGEVKKNLEKAYKVAYTMLYQRQYIKSWENSKILSKLSDAISLESVQALEEYLVEIIQEIIQRDMVLNTAMEERIEMASQVLQGRKFQKIWREYFLQQFEKLTKEEALQKLEHQKREQRMALCNDLWKREQCQEWVKQYYQKEFQKNESLEDLQEKIQEYLDLEFTSSFLDKEILSMADGLYLKICQKTRIGIVEVKMALDRKMDIYQMIDNHISKSKLEKISKNLYWEEMSILDIPFEDVNLKDYQEMEAEQNEKSNAVITLLYQYQEILQSIPKLANHYKILEDFSQQIDHLPIPEEERRAIQNHIFHIILEKFQEYEEEYSTEDNMVSLDSWLFLGYILREKGGAVFDIFDMMEDLPAIILEIKDTEKIEKMIIESELLKSNRYHHHIYRYIKKKGRYKKQVMQWKKYMETKEKPIGLVGKLLGRFKKY